MEQLSFVPAYSSPQADYRVLSFGTKKSGKPREVLATSDIEEALFTARERAALKGEFVHVLDKADANFVVVKIDPVEYVRCP